MLTQAPTRTMIREWQKIFQENKDRLTPNRKTGAAVDTYFREKYQPQKLTHPEFAHIAKDNLLQDDHHRSKLPCGASPKIAVYGIDNQSILVAIDLVTGFFQIESKHIARMAEIYDDLFLYRGLDEQDLENFFLMAQYVLLSKKEEKHK